MINKIKCWTKENVDSKKKMINNKKMMNKRKCWTKENVDSKKKMINKIKMLKKRKENDKKLKCS